MWLSSSLTPLRYKIPSLTVLPFTGRAGHTTVKSSPNSSSTASVTGSIFPFSVESKVAQYLKYICSEPLALSHLKASRLWRTASSAGIVRPFRAMTIALGVCSSFAGISLHRMTESPASARKEAASDAPVKSSATTPRKN